MSRRYGAQHRVLQDQHDTGRVADKVDALAVLTELGDMDRAFIESRDMFFFSSIDPNDPLLMEFIEAQLVVRVKVTEVWPNCPRYVHRYDKVKASRYVPRAECDTPLAGWKRIDLLRSDLPAGVTRRGR